VDDWYQKPQNKCLNVSQLQEKKYFFITKLKGSCGFKK